MLGRVLFLHVVIFSGVICGFAPPDRIIKVLQSFPTPKKRTVHMATVTLCDFFFFYISKVSLEHLSLLWTSLSLRVPLNLSSACRGWQLPPALIGTCLKRHLVPLSLPCHTKTPKFLLFYLPGICVCVWGGASSSTLNISASTLAGAAEILKSRSGLFSSAFQSHSCRSDWQQVYKVLLQ